MLYIVIGQCIVFLFSQMDTTGLLMNFLRFYPQLILKGQLWRLITFIFVPEFTNIFALAISLYFYYFVGGALERQWGSGKFTIFYFSGVLLTIIVGLIAGLLTNSLYVLFLNTHYINLSMFFAFAALFPETRLLLFFIIPVKVKWLAYFDAALFIYGMIVSPFPLSLLPAVAILNFFIFCGDILISSIGTFRRRYSPQAINFRKASKQVHRNQVNRTSTPYRRKCAVCGRTDTDYPNLEFRYCSRCAGYHCFCIDHINSHIHFKE
jgi:membrane associated rhomboid family serine protease